MDNIVSKLQRLTKFSAAILSQGFTRSKSNYSSLRTGADYVALLVYMDNIIIVRLNPIATKQNATSQTKNPWQLGALSHALV